MLMTRTKPLVWSFTLLKTYRDICPYQAYRRYVKKDIPFVPTEAMEYGNDVHSAMEMRVGGNKPLPDGMQQYEPIAAAFDGRNAVVEQKLGVTVAGKSCDFFASDVWGRGKLDLTLVQDETAYLADYKTGNPREDPFELEVQAVLLHAKHPQLTKIIGQYYWLKENRIGPPHDLSNTNKTWTEICRLMTSILNETEWEKRRNPLCGYCNVYDCEYNRNANR